MGEDWHDENCDCDKCSLYKSHDENCGCAICYYRERYYHHKKENEKLTKIRDDLVKGKWETLGNAEFNTNNKTVYEHDILMDEQRAYYEDRIKNIEEARRLELNAKTQEICSENSRLHSIIEQNKKDLDHLQNKIKFIQQGDIFYFEALQELSSENKKLEQITDKMVDEKVDKISIDKSNKIGMLELEKNELKETLEQKDKAMHELKNCITKLKQKIKTTDHLTKSLETLENLKTLNLHDHQKTKKLDKPTQTDAEIITPYPEKTNTNNLELIERQNSSNSKNKKRKLTDKITTVLDSNIASPIESIDLTLD